MPQSVYFEAASLLKEKDTKKKKKKKKASGSPERSSNLLQHRNLDLAKGSGSAQPVAAGGPAAGMSYGAVMDRIKESDINKRGPFVFNDQMLEFWATLIVQEKHAHATPFDVPPLSVQRWMKTGTHAAKGKAICKELNDGVLTAVNAGGASTSTDVWKCKTAQLQEEGDLGMRVDDKVKVLRQHTGDPLVVEGLNLRTKNTGWLNMSRLKPDEPDLSRYKSVVEPAEPDMDRYLDKDEPGTHSHGFSVIHLSQEIARHVTTALSQEIVLALTQEIVHNATQCDPICLNNTSEDDDDVPQEYHDVSDTDRD
mmetsp:Transcript_448/g.795  ORF Transcript_448/g.795 Transcript_448/m.795 type:complete len:310 (-) Transcript_448:206-1135(-)